MKTIKNKNISLSFNPLTGGYEITADGFSWVNDGRKPYVIIRKKFGDKYLPTYRPLQSAITKKTHISDNKIITRYSGFFAFGMIQSFALVCTAEITENNIVTFSLKAENEHGFNIQAVYFPSPFNSKTEGANSYAVDSMRQGFIMHDGDKESYKAMLMYTHYLRKINTGECYMPIWGRICDSHGFSAIVETPYDACMFSSAGKRNSFLNSVHWSSSLGKLRYERKIRFTFHSDCDYNTIAKDYRNYLKETNQFVSINDKIKINSNVEKLKGCAVLHHHIYQNLQTESDFYDKKENNSHVFASFEQRGEQLKKIHDSGLEKLYIHTDGWGKNGYDNDHPSILPPCGKAGGWEGFKNLSLTCENLGYIFGLHDQYRDYYYCGNKFDFNKAVMNIDGTHPYCSIWDGGKHTFLCASQAYSFVEDTYSQLKAHDVKIGGTYLDVFSVVQGDECFNSEHKLTRQQSIEERAKCFDYLNENGIIPSSEEPAMQLLHKLALVHHGPYPLINQGGGKPVGTPVPLLSLAVHDCVMIPWIASGEGGWGIPDKEKGELHCALNAGLPYFDPFVHNEIKIGTMTFNAEKDLLDDRKLKTEIEKMKNLGELQSRLADKEMVKHEFLDGRKIQRTTFSDETSVTADFIKGTYTVAQTADK